MYSPVLALQQKSKLARRTPLLETCSENSLIPLTVAIIYENHGRAMSATLRIRRLRTDVITENCYINKQYIELLPAMLLLQICQSLN